MAKLCDVYVNDAFGAAHRAHASTAGIAAYVKQAAAGFLMEKELESLSYALTRAEKPFVAIVGGAKISDKIDLIESFINIANNILVGGAMAYTFLRARGIATGKSLVESEKIAFAAGTSGLAVTVLRPAVVYGPGSAWLEEPLRIIASNAGVEGSLIVERVKGMKPGEGYNAETGEYGDLMKAGVIDPAKVTRSALQNAASIAALVLTTESAIVEKPEEEEPAAGGGHGHMH